MPANGRPRSRKSADMDNSWDKLFQSDFVPALRRLVEVLEVRLLPAFDNIDAEAKALTGAEWERCMSLPSSGDGCPSDFVDRANDAGASHWMALNNVRQSLLNLYAPALFHAWEQQLFRFYRLSHLRDGKACPSKEIDINAVEKHMKSKHIGLRSFLSWVGIEELRLVAHTVKHAAGRSCAQLKKRRPDLFIPPCLKGKGLEGNPFACCGKAPISDADFYLTLDDLKAYLDALLLFWDELANALRKAGLSPLA